MKFNSLQRIARAIPKVAVGVLGAYLLSSPASYGQSLIAITNWDGTVLSSAAGLYTTSRSCYNPTAGVTVCTYVLRRLYGNQSAVVVVAHGPGGIDPACYYGVTQQIAPGYSRSGCSIVASSDVYGIN